MQLEVVSKHKRLVPQATVKACQVEIDIGIID